MIKRILVPLGVSVNPKSIAEKSLQIAGSTGAQLTLLGVVDEPGINHPEPVPAGAYEYLEQKHKALIEKSEEQLKQLATEFQKECSNLKEAEPVVKLVQGEPAAEISKEAQRHDLIVMGQQSNYKFITQQNSCNTAGEVIKHSCRPVISVPPEIDPLGQGILLANDGSQPALRAIQLYQLLGLFGKHQVKIISIANQQERAQENCELAADYLSAHGIKTEQIIIETIEKPRTQLMKYISDHPPEILIMGAYGISNLKKLFFGSATRDIMEKSRIPLFIYH